MNRKEYLKQWRLANKDKIKDYNKQYNEEHKEERKNYSSEYHKQYYKKHRDEIIERAKQWIIDNSDYAKNARKIYNSTHSEEKRKWYEDYHNTKMGRAIYLYHNYCRHDEDKQRGKCTLTPEWIVENIFTSKCRYCGKDDWTELGCDRIDNLKPHTPDNVVCCCTDCNKRRNITEFEKFINDDSII